MDSQFWMFLFFAALAIGHYHRELHKANVVADALMQEKNNLFHQLIEVEKEYNETKRLFNRYRQEELDKLEQDISESDDEPEDLV